MEKQHSKVYHELHKLKINPESAKKAALEEIEKIEANADYAKKVKFNPLEWRIQLAFAWELTPKKLHSLWPQLVTVQLSQRFKVLQQ